MGLFFPYPITAVRATSADEGGCSRSSVGGRSRSLSILPRGQGSEIQDERVRKDLRLVGRSPPREVADGEDQGGSEDGGGNFRLVAQFLAKLPDQPRIGDQHLPGNPAQK